MLRLLLLISFLGSALAFPRQDSQTHGESQNLKPLLLLVERASPEQQKQEGLETKQQRQQHLGAPSALTFGGFPYFEPQFRYPGFNQQGYPRVQPSIVVYGAAGPGQPILINPGLPPGHNFLVPQQPRRPGPNNVPQRPPVFVGGYPNPKPAHIPPIEKDAEEIPTDPASIPPFPSTSSVGTKPEKLETFNEDNSDRPFKAPTEFDFSAAGGKFPALPPGHRFFILNGDNLFQDNLFGFPEDLKYTRLQAAPQYSVFPAHQEPVGFSSTSQIYPLQSGQQFDQNLVALSQESGRPEGALLRSSSSQLNGDPIGHFRFTPPSESYYSFEGDDVENEAVVVDAKYQDDDGQGGTSTEAQSSAVSDAEFEDKFSEPSTAQAAPGAIALAGKGGVAGASPKATSLAGKGGLAISSPQATAVAGADDEKVKEKNKKPVKNKSRNNK